MHKFFWIVSVLALGLASGRTQSMNIATWVIELPETNSTNRAAEYDPILRRAANVLKPVNADIILMHGFPDKTTARMLTAQLRPRIYHTPIVSSFKKNPQSSTVVEPPIAIMSRKQPVVARSIDWRTTGPLDVAGGFSLAEFQYGTNSLFLYTVQFPKMTTGTPPEQEALMPRNRELAARYLVAHLDWLITTSTNAGQFAYLATDLELDGPTSTNDPALKVLLASGFKSCSGSRTLVASTALSATGWPPEGGLVSAFVRGTDFPGDPESISAKGFFAPVALVDLDLRPTPSSVASTATAGNSSDTSNLTTATTPEIDPSTAASTGTWFNRLVRWIETHAIVTSLAGVVLLFLAAAILRARRQRSERALPSGDEERAALPSSSRLALARDPDSQSFHVLDHPTTPGVSAQSGKSSERGEDSGPARGSGWPFFHVLRERMVRWLAAERSQLLSSHHAGAEQVLELEERLTRIQNQFESRLRTREQRITDLEAELMSKEKSIAGLEQALAGREPRS